MDASIGDHFLYFGFASNLLAERIHMRNPTAAFETIARLQDHRLVFDYDSRTWMGASGNIEPSPGHHVWGAVWSLKCSDMQSLDTQEGVHLNVYKPVTVEVTSIDGLTMECRCYLLVKSGSIDQRPSPQYLDIIIKGAQQHKLPEKYIEQLRKIEHNGFAGSVPLYDEVMAKYNGH